MESVQIDSGAYGADTIRSAAENLSTLRTLLSQYDQILGNWAQPGGGAPAVGESTEIEGVTVKRVR